MHFIFNSGSRLGVWGWIGCVLVMSTAMSGCRSRTGAASDPSAQVGDANLEDQNAELEEYFLTPEWMKMQAAFKEAERPLEFRMNVQKLKYANTAGLSACVTAMSKSAPTFLDRLKAFDPVGKPLRADLAPITVLISNRNAIYADRYLNIPGKPHLEIDCYENNTDRAVDESQLHQMISMIRAAMSDKNQHVGFSAETPLDYLFWMGSMQFETKYAPQIEKLGTKIKALQTKTHETSVSIRSKLAKDYADVLVIHRKSDAEHPYVVEFSIAGDDERSWNESMARWNQLKAADIKALPTAKSFKGGSVRVVEQ